MDISDAADETRLIRRGAVDCARRVGTFQKSGEPHSSTSGTSDSREKLPRRRLRAPPFPVKPLFVRHCRRPRRVAPASYCTAALPITAVNYVTKRQRQREGEREREREIDSQEQRSNVCVFQLCVEGRGKERGPLPLPEAIVDNREITKSTELFGITCFARMITVGPGRPDAFGNLERERRHVWHPGME